MEQVNLDHSYRSDIAIKLVAFVKDKIADMAKCKDGNPWNFNFDNFDEIHYEHMHESLKNDWCLITRIFDLNWKVENISSTITSEEKELLKFYETKFLKIGNDGLIEYRDDKRLFICSPLYYNKKLPLNPKVKLSLTAQLNNLGNERKDWHDECPVLDIIDSDLNPNHFSGTDMQKLLDENFNKMLKRDNFMTKEEVADHVLSVFPFSLSLRSQYKWIPTEILINKHLKARFLGPIHNLPMKNHSELYSNILTVFETKLSLKSIILSQKLKRMMLGIMMLKMLIKLL